MGRSKWRRPIGSAVVNELASGTWRGAVGTHVEIIEYKPNGRAVLVRMPSRAPLHAGRDCWIPSRWIDTGAAIEVA